MMTKQDAKILHEDVTRESVYGRAEYVDVFGPSYALEALATIIEQHEELERLRNALEGYKHLYDVPVAFGRELEGKATPKPSLDVLLAERDDCGCDPFTVCGNVACPRRKEVKS